MRVERYWAPVLRAPSQVRVIPSLSLGSGYCCAQLRGSHNDSELHSQLHCPDLPVSIYTVTFGIYSISYCKFQLYCELPPWVIQVISQGTNNYFFSVLNTQLYRFGMVCPNSIFPISPVIFCTVLQNTGVFKNPSIMLWPKHLYMLPSVGRLIGIRHWII